MLFRSNIKHKFNCLLLKSFFEDCAKIQQQVQPDNGYCNPETGEPFQYTPLHVKKLYTATEIAKECGMPSASYLNNYLETMGIQYKVNGTWVLKSDYSEKGYTSIKQGETDTGHIYYDRKFTQEGRAFILSLVNDEM